MKIGIDLDGVVLDTERLKKSKAEIYDILDLNSNNLISKSEISIKKRYNWTEEEKEYFSNMWWKVDIEEINVMPYAKKVIELLKKDGHELIVITARGIHEADKESVETKLKKENIIFDKYYWSSEEKLEVCKKENIDIMIDDRVATCLKTSKNRIKTLYFRDVRMPKLQENEYLTEVNNWGEVYRYIYN